MQAIQLFSMPTSSGIQSISQCTGLKSGKLKLLTNDGETIILGSEDKQGREIAALLKQRAETVLTALKIDPDLSVAKLREGARLLWMSTTGRPGLDVCSGRVCPARVTDAATAVLRSCKYDTRNSRGGRVGATRSHESEGAKNARLGQRC